MGAIVVGGGNPADRPGDDTCFEWVVRKAMIRYTGLIENHD